jgi:hypothetical protein
VRRIAQFLFDAAAEMEKSERRDHRHAQDMLKPWDYSWPDVIVARADQK